MVDKTRARCKQGPDSDVGTQQPSAEDVPDCVIDSDRRASRAPDGWDRAHSLVVGKSRFVLNERSARPMCVRPDEAHNEGRLEKKKVFVSG